MTRNHRQNSFRAALVAALLAFGAGCHLAPAEGSSGKRGQSPSPPALVDENYRVKLDWPGHGWQMHDNRSARAPASDTGLCSFDEEQSLSGCISVAHAPPASLRAYATDWLNRISYIDRATVTRKSAEYLGQPAEFFDASGTYSHAPSHVTGVVFYYQEYVYRALVRGPADKFDRTRARRFMESVHLLPGKVRDPADQREPMPKSGLGFRVAKGVYENGIKDFKVALDPNWRVVAGSAQREFDPDADLVLMRENPDIATSIRISAEHRKASTLSSVQENHRRNFEIELLDEHPHLAISGIKASSRLGRAGSGNMVLYSGFSVGDRSVELTARFAELYRDEALRLVERVGNSVAIVPAGNRNDFEQSFVADTLREHRVGREHALRHGCYRDYSAGLGWCHPEGFWNFDSTDEMRTSDDGALLRAQNLGNGVSLSVFSRTRSERGAPLFEGLANEYGVDSAQTSQVGVFTRATQRRRVNERSYLYSVTRGADEIAALVSCGNMGPGCGDTADNLVKRLDLKDFGSALEFTDSGLVDRRLGVQLQLPNAYHARSREELPTEGGQRATWESTDASVTLLTALDGDTDEKSRGFSEVIDRITLAAVPTALLHQGHSKAISVAGNPADSRSYVGLNYRFDTVKLRHGRVLVACLVASRSADKLQEVLSGLQLLE